MQSLSFKVHPESSLAKSRQRRGRSMGVAPPNTASMERLLEMMRQMDESSSGEEEEVPLLGGESESEGGELQLMT